jgi:hypothetical protein
MGAALVSNFTVGRGRVRLDDPRGLLGRRSLGFVARGPVDSIGVRALVRRSGYSHVGGECFASLASVVAGTSTWSHWRGGCAFRSRRKIRTRRLSSSTTPVMPNARASPKLATARRRVVLVSWMISPKIIHTMIADRLEVRESDNPTSASGSFGAVISAEQATC